MAGRVALDMFVGSYPPEIRAAFGPMSSRAARWRPYVATLIVTVAIAIPLVGIWRYHRVVAPIGTSEAFGYAVLALGVFNTYDLLVLDWLFFCTIQLRAMILPGTEGMAAYRDYRFHFIGWLKGLAFAVVIGAVIAVMWGRLAPRAIAEHLEVDRTTLRIAERRDGRSLG